MQLLWVKYKHSWYCYNTIYKYTECTETNKLAAKPIKLSIATDLQCLIPTVLEWIILLFCLNLLFKVRPLL